MSSRPRLVGPPRPNNTSFLLNGLDSAHPYGWAETSLAPHHNYW